MKSTRSDSPSVPKCSGTAAEATIPSSIAGSKRATASEAGDAVGTSLRAILIGLMVPMGMTVLNLQMYSVALPSIRDSFGIGADTVALSATAYMLPFVIFMPLYGQFSDGLGKRRLFSIGIIIFSLGTVVCLMSTSFLLLLVGRVLQGIGTAGVNPLCIAIITDLFPPSVRGRAMGTWSSTGPATSMIAPLFGGFLIDHWGWHSIFIPGVIASFIALYVVRGRVPKLEPPHQPGFLRNFDWIGLALLSLTIIALVVYLSSSAITGVAPLQDWKMLLLSIAFAAAFTLWERRSEHPMVRFSLYKAKGFGLASFVASIRMFLMSGVGLLLPLYFADVKGMGAAMTGLFITFVAGSMLSVVRMAGGITDKRSKRFPIITGLSMQTTALVMLALLPADLPNWVIPPILIVYGVGAGLSLAVLHRLAMDHVPHEESGTAAGLYSMGRFFGSIIGTTLIGVFLQQALTQVDVSQAYSYAFWFAAAVALIGIAAISRVRD